MAGNAAQAREPGASQEMKEYSLCLIVGVVSGSNAIEPFGFGDGLQPFIARLARGGFEIATACFGSHIPTLRAARQAQLACQFGDELGVLLAFRAAESVIEM